MAEQRNPGIYLVTDTGAEVEIILVDVSGQTNHLSKRTPAEDLVAFVGRDYSDYREAVEALWKEHPVFEERDKTPLSDYEEFEKDALLISEMLRDLDPVAYLDIARQIAVVQKMTDDGDPIFAAHKAFAVLEALRAPYRIQNRMRNIFEIGFADFERGTQQNRFQALESVWPGMVDRSFPVRFVAEPNGKNPIGTKREYQPSGLYEFYLIELSLYFQQGKKRIVRCENCWRYFIPRIATQTLYCDGEMEGIPCKSIGPKLKRTFDADMDEAVKVYNRLRHTFAERANRYETAAPFDREKLKPFSKEQYDDWLEMAQKRKKRYEAGEISAEEFLQTIDTFHELESYDAKRVILPAPDRTRWRELIKRNIDFDPKKSFMDMDFLDMGMEELGWEIITSEQQIFRARGGHESLRARYGTESPVDPTANKEALDRIFIDLDGEDQEAIRLICKLIDGSLQ